MEATQSYPNLLSEKQAAKRLGVARITLLRAREAGRIRFFRIGTRVLYCDEQLTEFLNSCERNARKAQDGGGRGAGRHAARRKDNRVSASPSLVSPRETATVDSATASSKVDQASLPFSATR
jgi:excisionase family DNA binding protein